MQGKLMSEQLAPANFQQEPPFDRCRQLIKDQMAAPSPMFVQDNKIFSRDDPHFCLQFESVQTYVREQVMRATDILFSNKHFWALKEYRWAEMVVDIYLENAEDEFPEDVVLLLLANLGICFLHFNFLDDAFSCFDSCEGRMESRLTSLNKYVDYKSSTLDVHAFSIQLRLTSLKILLGRIKLVKGVILEEVGRKDEALHHYKDAVCIGMDLLMDLLMSVMMECGLAGQGLQNNIQYPNRARPRKKQKPDSRQLLTARSTSLHRRSLEVKNAENPSARNIDYCNGKGIRSLEKITIKKPRHRLEELLSSPAHKLLFIFYKNTQDLLSYFRRASQKNSFMKRFMRRHPSASEIDLPISRIKEAFVKGHNLYNQDLAFMLSPKPITIDQLNLPFNSKSIAMEFVLELIIHLTLSLFQLSALRMITDHKVKYESSRAHSEILMNKSIELAYSFLPLNSLFVKQIITQHNNLFGVYKQTIPQYGGFSESIKFLKSSLNSGSTTRLFVPIIRSLKIKQPLESSDSDGSAQQNFLIEGVGYNKQKVEQLRQSLNKEQRKTKDRKEASRKPRPTKDSIALCDSLIPRETPLMAKIVKLIKREEGAQRKSKHQAAGATPKCRWTRKTLSINPKSSAQLVFAPQHSPRSTKFFSIAAAKTPPPQ